MFVNQQVQLVCAHDYIISSAGGRRPILATMNVLCSHKCAFVVGE